MNVTTSKRVQKHITTLWTEQQQYVCKDYCWRKTLLEVDLKLFISRYAWGFSSPAIQSHFSNATKATLTANVTATMNRLITARQFLCATSSLLYSFITGRVRVHGSICQTWQFVTDISWGLELLCSLVLAPFTPANSVVCAVKELDRLILYFSIGAPEMAWFCAYSLCWHKTI